MVGRTAATDEAQDKVSLSLSISVEPSGVRLLSYDVSSVGRYSCRSGKAQWVVGGVVFHAVSKLSVAASKWHQ